VRHNTSWHHRRPRSLGGKDDYRNVIELPVTHHQAWHTLFNNWTPEVIARVINEYYLDPDFKFIVKERRDET
jgi:hypothetical protein